MTCHDWDIQRISHRDVRKVRDTIRYFIEAVRIVLARFIRQGRILPNQDASDAGLSIVAFN